VIANASADAKHDSNIYMIGSQTPYDRKF
jgi:hypothetical protein